jgi:Rieske Fe-S protein
MRRNRFQAGGLTRRDWVRRFVLGSAMATGAGGWKAELMADLSPGADPSNVLTFKISELPPLQSVNGSMRLSLFGELVPNGVITLTRGPGDVFYAMSAYCTHEGCIVDPYDPTPETQAMICYCHGSIYDIQGRLIYGVEAGQADLPRYNTEFANGVLRVEIPGLNFKVNGVSLVSESEGSKRLRLTFNARKGGKYRVRFTSSLEGQSVLVPFAQTAGGAGGLTPFVAQTNAMRDFWVDYTGDRGFFEVEMVVEPYQPG